MTPRLRPLVISAALLAATVLPSSYVSAYAAEPAPSETFAGSVPGEGRARPGRADPPPPPPPSPSASVPVQPPKPVHKPVRTTASDATRKAAAGPVTEGLRLLPLGSGLLLIGLGLGFFAVRLRGG
ncbi:hypothetical protein ACIBKX_22630 [Streptomyces sp. NPDC050658]|uniref:hypothetical protein n=1 Tax=unclassified Streptomyces TaxID=2593676 RepID=UPI0034352F59